MIKKGFYFGFIKRDYEFLKATGVNHNLMKQINSNPHKVLEFYRARINLGKTFACVKKEKYEEILNFVETMLR